ncbi:MAG: sigma 54-interacting transcriptional regulator, partial [Alphaproteobacteria bacterium]|nr:sigma 54-interacting transcriptional regulator [Alphaproteobacteria bacterium]
PLETQGKILRVLQESKIYPLGSQKAVEIDVRVLASTNRDLDLLIQNGDFREDLYYRLNVVRLDIPPLSKRRDDILPLAEYFLKNYASQMGQQASDLSEEAARMLSSCSWPGNVRQLKNVMEWVTIMLPDIDKGTGKNKGKILPEHLPPELNGAPSQDSKQEDGIDYYGHPLREAREMFERQYLGTQMTRFDGNISKMAKFIGMERSALHRKLKSLDISAGDKQDSGQDVMPFSQKSA